VNLIFDPSLVLYLPLYELDGSSFVSRDACGHLCTVTGALWRKNGRYFDGVDDIIDCGNKAPLIITGNSPRTGEVWFKSSGDYTDDRALLSYGPGGGGSYWIRFGLSLTDGYLSLSLLANDHYTTTTPPANEWHHAAFTLAGTTTVIYYNGEVLSTKTDHSTINTQTGTNFYIGRRGQGPTDYWKGDIGEARFYNRVLTPLEIQQNYLATKWRYR